MLYVRFPRSLRNVEDLRYERGIDVSHETVRSWRNRFGPMFAAEIRRKRVDRIRSGTRWQWHLDEVFVKINEERHYLWRAVDHESEVMESYVTNRRDCRAAPKSLKKAMRRHGPPQVMTTGKLRSYGAAMKIIGNAGRQETGREFTPATSMTRTLHASLQTDAKSAEIRRHPRLCPQPFQLATTSLFTNQSQAQPHHRSRQVASTWRGVGGDGDWDTRDWLALV